MSARLLVLSVLLTLVPCAAFAQSEPEAPSADVASDAAAEAQALFRRGIALSAEDRWADALEHFRRSYARVPRPSTQFNIGVALGRLGRFVEAIEVFDQVLLEASLPAAPRAEAERLRAEAVASLGELTLSITPPTASLSVDGVIRAGLGSPRTLPLDPGRHVLRATAPEHGEAVLEVSVVAGERAERSLTLALLEVALTNPEPLAPPSRSLFEEPAFWIVGGVLVVAIGVGVGVGVAVSTPPPQYGGSTGVVLLAP